MIAQTYLGITDDDRRYWDAYARTLADHLRLRDWNIAVSHGTASGETYAQIWLQKDHREGIIYLSPAWSSLDPAFQRSCLVHELLHCHLHDLELLVAEFLQRLDGPLKECAEALVHREAERIVGALEDVLAPLLPLPPAATAETP